MAELKPCPFCGGEARVSTRMDEDIWSHNTVPYTRVACNDCEIGTDYLCEGWEPTAEEAWNSRVADGVKGRLVDCGECRTEGCPEGRCRNAGVPEVDRG